jgi:hypothetical protein
MGNVTVKGGVGLGVLVFLWTLVMGVTGWYKHPTLLNLFWVVILIEVVVLIWALRATAATTEYLGQVGKGTLVAAIGAVIIFCGSLLFTSVLFPNYFEELRVIQTEMMRSSGRTQTEIDAALALGATMQTPVINALMGAIGTIVTGLLASLIIAIFHRKK